MHRFEEILDIAVARKGSREAVLADCPVPKPVEEIAAIPDDRWLAGMARGIFQAGISWTVVDKKWPEIEAAFRGFDVGAVSMMSEAWFDELVADTRVIRSAPKIAAIRDNATFLRALAEEGTGGFGRRVADWPEEDFIGLLDWLKREGARLGGGTGAYLLRSMGKDSFILSKDVVARLVAEGVIDKAPGSRKAMQAVQDAFNTWRAESGETLTTISRVLAKSIG
ncbi:DNA-3-methyladenine glycosylase I [Salipiger sp. P9]|uniref:DNA-3-methyladenine glycosylase I n=1 Tax=Salipiger pentaromativorans TaxID=2943193 RepID=UPI002157C31D|nr:DNA-3-methyladenine glycosylase I [Salipiger pentaromativorans]MCR8546405.1 DNA-3-methyladenine glycosylase I [Salipiger pentaromativorans]